MGLSGRREKQRIPNDPRNLSWADSKFTYILTRRHSLAPPPDAAKFGQAYLSKLGWDPSQGLGADGDGRTSHIKVSQKLDMLGIGAAQVKDPNGIAWKQNKEFEALLKRLNEDVDDSLDKEDEVRMGEDAVSENAKKKRTKDADGKDKKKKKLKDKSTGDPPPVGAPSQEITSVTPCASDKTFTPRHMAYAHRLSL
jgi:Pin2-interacting protein X1